MIQFKKLQIKALYLNLRYPNVEHRVMNVRGSVWLIQIPRG